MGWAEGIAAATAILSIGCFVLYVVAIMGMPVGRRPHIIPRDRLGRPLPADENPDYRDTEGSENENPNYRDTEGSEHA